MEEDEELDIATADANDAAACSIVRSKAIFALSHLIRHRKTIISSILMPIYFNKEEPAQIRMSALTLLFVADQTPAFWQVGKGIQTLPGILGSRKREKLELGRK